MSVYGTIINNQSFDIHDIDDTETSTVRGPTTTRLSYKHDGKLIQFVKQLNDPVLTKAGALLVAKHGVLCATNDRRNHRTVA